jgi:tRNA 2-thiocytidine biosynthesis protein TtcA
MTAADPRRHEFERNKRAKRIRRLVGEAIADYRMIEPGDRVMVCLSGGKDSYGLLDVLLSLQRHAPQPFEVVAMHLDQAHPGYPADVLPDYLATLGIPFRIARQDTYSTVKRLVPEGQTMCSLCSRLRRGVIYRVAGEMGATKIALGHHREDLLETLLLNMFFGGRLKSMAPKLVSDDGRHVVIRPLMYVAEADLAALALDRAFPIIPCDLCGSQENLQRKQIKQMLVDWDRRFPGRLDNMLHAMQHVSTSHLADRTLQDFAALAPDGRVDPEGDTAFDRPEVADAAERLSNVV